MFAGLEFADIIQAACLVLLAASNISTRKCSCVIVEQDWKFLFKNGIHHINEIIMSDVYQKCSEVSTVPEMSSFEWF